jgi:hypothetical protein
MRRYEYPSMPVVPSRLLSAGRGDDETSRGSRTRRTDGSSLVKDDMSQQQAISPETTAAVSPHSQLLLAYGHTRKPSAARIRPAQHRSNDR